MIVRTKQEAKRAKRSAAGTCCPLKLVIGSLFFQADPKHIMKESLIQTLQAVDRKINQKIKTFKDGHLFSSGRRQTS